MHTKIDISEKSQQKKKVKKNIDSAKVRLEELRKQRDIKIEKQDPQIP